MGTGARPSVASRSRLLLPLVTAVVALAVVLGAAVAAPWHLEPGDPAEIEMPAATASAPQIDVGEPEPPPEPAEDGGVPLILWAVTIALVLLVLALRTFLARASFTRGAEGGAVETAAGAVLPAQDASLDPDLPALRRGVEAARAVLTGHAEPDDAIIAAWLELEAAAASSGVDRAPSDTPTEFTTAVLDATHADPQATRTLLGLYHRARFAPHAVLGAAEVTQAVRCLEAIAESWEEA